MDCWREGVSELGKNESWKCGLLSKCMVYLFNTYFWFVIWITRTWGTWCAVLPKLNNLWFLSYCIHATVLTGTFKWLKLLLVSNYDPLVWPLLTLLHYVWPQDPHILSLFNSVYTSLFNSPCLPSVNKIILWTVQYSYYVYLGFAFLLCNYIFKEGRSITGYILNNNIKWR